MESQVRMPKRRAVDGEASEPTTELGRIRRNGVRLLAALGLVSFSFMLVFVISDAAGRVEQQEDLVRAGSREAEIGAAYPGEAVHITGALAGTAIGGSGLVGLIIRPQRAGSATQVGAAAVAMVVTAGVVGNPDNYGGQASPIDPAFVVLAVPPLAAALLAAPWRTWQSAAPRRPGLLLLALASLPALWYGFDQGLMQRNTWPPLADPHHQAHWWAMSLLAFVIVLVVAGAALPGRGWRVVAVTAAIGAFAVAIVSLLFPTSGSALHPLWAVGAVLWALAVLTITWRYSRPTGGTPR